MESKELRIGNLVKKGEEIFEADFITIQMANNYEPIPLTEEYLLKFGYFKIEHKECHFVVEGHTIWICNNMYLCEKNGIILKHVHQLQNLYFALTNKELTL